MNVMYDSTFYTGKNPTGLVTFPTSGPGAVPVPCLAGCKPIHMADRGLFDKGWRAPDGTVSIELFLAALDALPPDCPDICLDVERDPRAELVMLNAAKRERPDVAFGVYIGPKWTPGVRNGDLPDLFKGFTEPQRDVILRADFAAPSVYAWPGADGVLYRNWLGLWVSRVMALNDDVRPVISRHCHPQSEATSIVDSDTDCGDTRFQEQLKACAFAGGKGILWGGRDFAGAKNLPWNPAGLKWFWQVQNWLRPA